MNLETVIQAVYLFLPAYFANASPVIFGGGAPLDGGVNWLDGKPFLGGHKTTKGTIFGIVIGTIVGLAQGNLLGGALQSVGAMLGDIITSFLKRRINIEPGESFPLADQLDFILFAVILSYPIQYQSWETTILIIIVTLPLHYLTNVIAYFLGLKKHPW
ncbi:CDP-2,3-bis-(O-geranylgeranyl)-sn-glycerol synthase [Candidatus Bathyarchaeota archaeon]|nr:CDP-2,3-bis-(O-geranylgeranyl)-sn-glycerol synthase [Candidatus Bathyarchaeota archaeon]